MIGSGDRDDLVKYGIISLRWVIRAIHTGGCRYRHSTTYEHHENFQILRTDSYKDFMVVTHAYKWCTVKRQAKIKQSIVQKYGSFCYRATKVYLPLKRLSACNLCDDFDHLQMINLCDTKTPTDDCLFNKKRS